MTRSNPLLDFEAEGHDALVAMTPRMRGAFATACAERLFAAYQVHVEMGGFGDVQIIRQSLDAAWNCALDDREPTGDETRLVEECVALIPTDTDPEQIPPYADDAVAAAAYALDTFARHGDVESAGWAAGRGFDTLDDYVVTRDHLDVNTPGTMDLVWADPLVQAEWRRRVRDLDSIRERASVDPTRLVEDLRAEAAKETVLPLDSLPLSPPRPA